MNNLKDIKRKRLTNNKYLKEKPLSNKRSHIKDVGKILKY